MKEQKDGSITLEDSTSILQVWKKLKNSIFDVLFVLLDNSDEEQSLLGLAFQTGVDYLQMMAFPFDGAVIAVWNAGSTLQSITAIFGKLNVSTYIPGIQFNTFLILLYSLIFMIILVMLDIIYVGYSFSKKKFQFTWPLVLLAKIVPLFVTVLFLPIMQTLLEVVNCSEEGSTQAGQQVMGTFPDVVCWEGWHLFHSVITLLFSSIFVFISCIVTLALFEPRMTTNRLTARQNSTGQVVFIINKIICQLLFSFSPFSTSLPYTFMLFLLSGWLYSTYNIHQPYYNSKASKFFRILSTYYFWTNLMLMISEVLKPFDFKGGLVVWICGLLCLGLGIIFERKSNIDTLFSSSLKFKSGEDLQSHLQYVLKLLHQRNEDKNSYMLLLGYIQKHIQLCTEDDCPLMVVDPSISDGKQQEEYSCSQLLKQLERMFKNGIKKYPSCTKLRLSFAFFYMEKINNTRKAYEQFTKATMTDPSFGEQFIIYRFRKIIKENLQVKAENGDKADLIEMIRFDNYISLCEEGMLLSARLHKQFWIELQEESPNLRKLNKIGSSITETLTIVKQNYEQVLKLQNNSIQLQYNYAFYSIFIIQNIEYGKSLLYDAKIAYEQKYKEFVEEGDEEDDFQMEKENSCIMIVSIEKKNVFKIHKVNNKLIELVKYSHEELINRDMNRIMPNLFKNSIHDKIVQDWLQNDSNIGHSEGSYVDNKRKGFIKDKAGYIRRVDYTVKYIYEIQRFIVQIVSKPESNGQFMLLADKFGNIIDYTYRAHLYLKQQIHKDIYRAFEVQVEEMHIPQTQQSPQPYILKGKQNKQLYMYGQRITKKITMQPNNNNYELFKMNNNDSFEMRQDIGYILRFIEVKELKKTKFSSLQKTKQLGLQFPKPKSIIQYEYEKKAKCKKKQQLEAQVSINSKIQKIEVRNEKEMVKFEEGIKSYRYWQGKMKRIYLDEILQTESDYDFEEMKTDLQGHLNKQKLGQYHYQEKIRKAINTKIWHPQLNCLLYGSTIVIIMFVVCLIGNYMYLMKELEAKSLLIENVYNNTENTHFIVEELSQPVMCLQDNVEYADKISEMQDYWIDYHILPSQQMGEKPSQYLQEYVLSDNSIRSNSITMKHALITMQADIITYYVKLNEMNSNNTINNQSFTQEQLKIVCLNYVKNVYPILNSVPNLIKKEFGFYVLFIIFCTFVWVSFSIFWIYNILRVKRKIYNILIWFLDIPLDYVSYLHHKCLYFIKNYSGVKEIQEKKLKIHQETHYIDEYHGLVLQNDEEQSQEDQLLIKSVDFQNNNRKILVTRYRKQDLFSKFNKKYFFIFLIVVIGSFYSLFLYLYKIQTINSIDFLLHNYQINSMVLLWVQTLPLSIKLQLLKAQGLYQNIDLDLITTLRHETKNNFLNTLTKMKLPEIITTQKNKQDEISDLITNIFQGNVCSFLANQNIKDFSSEECLSIAKSSLNGGLSIYFQFLGHVPNSECSLFLKQIYVSQKKYVSVALKLFLKELYNTMKDEIASLKSVLQIILYVYASLFFLSFFIVWIYYLRITNLKLNRTIQMLNMIPMVLLPESRKEMRDFLNWILIQSVSSKQ